MNTGARLGLAVTAGYLLGRFHKMKWALGLAALAGRGQLPSGAGGLVQQGAKLLTSSPEFTKLTEEMKGRLVDAGKAAAVAAVSSKIDSLSEGLRERSEGMRAARAGGAGGAAAGGEQDAESERDRDEDSRRARDRDEDVDGRDQAGRVPPPRGESGRARAGRQSRSREERAADDRGSHPSRHDREDAEDAEGDGGRRQSAGSRPRGEGRSGPRSSASRDGG
jgi:hypothetical protein